MKDCKTCIWFGKEKPGQCGNYLCRNQSEYDPRTGVEEADPTADVVEVVRCRDCVHFQQFRPHDGFCKIDGMLWNDDFFCANGMRKGS